MLIILSKKTVSTATPQIHWQNLKEYNGWLRRWVLAAVFQGGARPSLIKLSATDLHLLFWLFFRFALAQPDRGTTGGYKHFNGGKAHPPTLSLTAGRFVWKHVQRLQEKMSAQRLHGRVGRWRQLLRQIWGGLPTTSMWKHLCLQTNNLNATLKYLDRWTKSASGCSATRRRLTRNGRLFSFIVFIQPREPF